MTTKFQDTETTHIQHGVIYGDYDRFLCSHCCGTSVKYTGVSIDGYKVKPITLRDVQDWPADLGALTCECGRLTATKVLGPTGSPLTLTNSTDGDVSW